MEILRYGAKKYHGVQNIKLRTPIFSWNPTTACITIKQMEVRDFSGKSNHNYTINISIDEMHSLLLSMSEAAIVNSVFFEKWAATFLQLILRFQTIISGKSRI